MTPRERSIPPSFATPLSGTSRPQKGWRIYFPPARIFLFLVIVIAAQPHLEPARWWWSPTIAPLLGLTPEQSTRIERLYQDGLPRQMRTVQEIAYLVEQITELNGSDTSHDEVIALAKQLAQARSVECQIRSRMLDLTGRALRPGQREKLARLIRQKRVMESTCVASTR
jgi:Spy/CpxP family protein refolding chaperone